MSPYQNKDLMEQKLVIENKSYQQTARELGCSFTAVRNWAIKFGFTKENEYIVFNRKYGKAICEEYQQSNVLIKDLADKYGVITWYIQKCLELNNILLKDRQAIKKEMDNRNLCRILGLNHDYFKTWSSNMAYILGFISADGCISKNKNTLRIDLQPLDKEILEKIKDELQFEGVIHNRIYKAEGKSYDVVELSVSSQTLVNDLKSLGITERKSFTIQMPSNIPGEFELDFIRGYFDGDGSVGGQYPTNKTGLRTKTCQIRVRICSGSLRILEQIRDILTKHGMQHRPVTQYPKRPNYFDLCYSTFESMKFYELIYQNDEHLFLKRKKDKFDELIALRNK